MLFLDNAELWIFKIILIQYVNGNLLHSTRKISLDPKEYDPEKRLLNQYLNSDQKIGFVHHSVLVVFSFTVKQILVKQ
jgi:hypothetical protein